MPVLEVKFAHVLRRTELVPTRPVHGPLFHQWLPNGEEDAISLPTDSPSAAMRVWFNQRGCISPFDGVVVYDEDRNEITSDLIAKQGGLDAGPIFGRLSLLTIADPAADAMRNGMVGDPAYVAVGKQVANLVYSRVSTFIDLLRINLGQYWLQKLEPWDSRTTSLGAYCYSWTMEWRLDGAGDWEPFEPDEKVSRLTMFASKPDPAEYLSKQDWVLLERIMQDGYRSTLAGEVLVRANALSHQGDQRAALIEATTAAELAVGEFLRGKAAGNSAVMNGIGKFENLPLPAQVGLLASILDVDPKQIEQSLAAITIRNKIVHEGDTPTSDEEAKRLVWSLLKTVGMLIGDPPFRFPGGTVG